MNCQFCTNTASGTRQIPDGSTVSVCDDHGAIFDQAISWYEKEQAKAVQEKYNEFENICATIERKCSIRANKKYRDILHKLYSNDQKARNKLVNLAKEAQEESELIVRKAGLKIFLLIFSLAVTALAAWLPSLNNKYQIGIAVIISIIYLLAVLIIRPVIVGAVLLLLLLSPIFIPIIKLLIWLFPSAAKPYEWPLGLQPSISAVIVVYAVIFAGLVTNEFADFLKGRIRIKANYRWLSRRYIFSISLYSVFIIVWILAELWPFKFDESSSQSKS